MNVVLRLIACMVVFLLSSCATVNTTTSGECKQMCIQKLNSCKSICTNNCPNCSASSAYSSTINHAKYVHEQRIVGGYVARELNSYRDPLQCRKVTCNCSADYSACNQKCTGVIRKSLEAVPYCT